MLRKKALVVHSGGMDSSLCLALAINEFGKDHVLSVSFVYGQRHLIELKQAAKICRDWEVDHIELHIDCLQEITTSALIGNTIPIEHHKGSPPNTLVMGRNGLMAHVAGIHAENLEAHCVYLGVIELDSSNSGYRDCSRAYMELQQQILRIDLDDPAFEIRTPLVYMTKKETLTLAMKLGVLNYLLEETVTCYEGILRVGCKQCPACQLRNEGIREFSECYPEYSLPYCP